MLTGFFTQADERPRGYDYPAPELGLRIPEPEIRTDIGQTVLPVSGRGSLKRPEERREKDLVIPFPVYQN